MILGAFESKNSEFPVKTLESPPVPEKLEATDLPERINGTEIDSIRETGKLEAMGLPDRIDILEQIKAKATPDSNTDSTDTAENKNDTAQQVIEKSLGLPEGIRNLLERHPEFAEKWQALCNACDILNDPDASIIERRAAIIRISQIKGELMEIAVKDALADAGLDVENHQHSHEGESGKTRPDVVATNNTDKPIIVLGIVVNPGESISVECKCGSKYYISNQLDVHIPNQLSGQLGHRVLITTSDVPKEKAETVCHKYGATLCILDISTCQVETAIKKEAGKE